MRCDGKPKVFVDDMEVACIGKIEVVTRRGAHAGSMTFSTPIDVGVGSCVELYFGGAGVFAGKVFSVKKCGGISSCEAFDSLRYLAGREAFSLVDVTADAVVRASAAMFGLECGRVAETRYKIGTVFDEASALTVIEDALAMTADAGFGTFVLIDDFGKPALLPIGELIADSMASPAESLEYSVTESLGDDHYNYVTVVRYVDDVRNVYVAEDKDDIQRYGKLSYLRRLRTSEIGQLAADAALKAHLSVAVGVKCSLQFFDPTICGGGIVNAEVGGASRAMVCDECRCVFGPDIVRTELTLSSV